MSAQLNTQPIDQLMWIVSLLRAVTHIHEGVAAQADRSADWVESAVFVHVYEGVPLDRALGLAGDKGRQPRYYALLRERNQLLSLALKAVDGDVSALVDEISRYEDRISFVQREQKAPDPAWSDVRKHIHAAALLGVGLVIPRTEKGIHKTLEITRRKN